MKTDADIDALLLASMAPHIARVSRRILGYPEGNLICAMCGATNASHNRQRSNYHDSDNMVTLCPSCQQETDEYYDELWNEYYSGR